MRTRWNMSVCSRSIRNLEVLVFKERGKPEHLEKNVSEQGREPTTNSINPHMGLTPGFEPVPHWWEASTLTTATPLLPCQLNYKARWEQVMGDKVDLSKGAHWRKPSGLNALQSSSRGSSKKGKRDPCMAKKVMLKFATCTKVKQSLYSLPQLILQFTLLRLMLRALSAPSFVSQCYTAQH